MSQERTSWIIALHETDNNGLLGPVVFGQVWSYPVTALAEEQMLRLDMALDNMKRLLAERIPKRG